MLAVVLIGLSLPLGVYRPLPAIHTPIRSNVCSPCSEFACSADVAAGRVLLREVAFTHTHCRCAALCEPFICQSVLWRALHACVRALARLFAGTASSILCLGAGACVHPRAFTHVGCRPFDKAPCVGVVAAQDWNRKACFVWGARGCGCAGGPGGGAYGLLFQASMRWGCHASTASVRGWQCCVSQSVLRSLLPHMLVVVSSMSTSRL